MMTVVSRIRIDIASVLHLATARPAASYMETVRSQYSTP
jgi:hypothetical protein